MHSKTIQYLLTLSLVTPFILAAPSMPNKQPTPEIAGRPASDTDTGRLSRRQTYSCCSGPDPCRVESGDGSTVELAPNTCEYV